MWKRIAEGDTDTDLMRWLHKVARRLLEADEDRKNLGPQQRVYEITAAVGLSNKIDKNEKLRQLIEALEGFYPLEEIDGESVPRPFRRGEEMKALIHHARSKGLVPDDASDPEIRKRIERILKDTRRKI
jgi:hypothetical protein